MPHHRKYPAAGVLWIVFLSALMLACQLGAAAPSPSAAPLPTATPTVSPTSTPTPLPLPKLNLHPYLLLPDDLPPEYTLVVGDTEPWGAFAEYPQPVNAFYQRFKFRDEAAGGVVVLLYSNAEDREAAYQMMLEGMTEDRIPVDGLGESAEALPFASTHYSVTTRNVDLAFTRCTAAVFIRLWGTDDVAIATDYAALLEERLAPMVCQ